MIESFTNLYKFPILEIVTLHTRGKPNKIIRIDTGIQITKITMKEAETVDKYLARARTLFKAKLKYTSQWNTQYYKSDMWCIVHGLRLTNLKNSMQKKICKYKSYKQCFDAIKEAWEQTHYMDDDYPEQTQRVYEVSKIQEWDKTTLDKNMLSKQK